MITAPARVDLTHHTGVFLCPWFFALKHRAWRPSLSSHRLRCGPGQHSGLVLDALPLFYLFPPRLVPVAVPVSVFLRVCSIFIFCFAFGIISPLLCILVYHCFLPSANSGLMPYFVLQVPRPIPGFVSRFDSFSLHVCVLFAARQKCSPHTVPFNGTLQRRR